MGMTLAKLRYRLALRLGFATEGQAAQRQADLLNEFLRDAQELIYWGCEEDRFIKRAMIDVGVGQYFMDLPANFEHRKPFKVYLKDDQRWVELARDAAFGKQITDANLTPFARAKAETVTPFAYRIIGNQFELFPAIDERTLVRVDYWQTLPRFVDDDDELLMPDELVFRMALISAKAHYQQDDLQVLAKQLDGIQGKMRAGQHIERRYVPRYYRD